MSSTSDVASAVPVATAANWRVHASVEVAKESVRSPPEARVSGKRLERDWKICSAQAAASPAGKSAASGGRAPTAEATTGRPSAIASRTLIGVAVGERGAHEDVGGGHDGERALALELAEVMHGAVEAAGARGGGERGGARAGAVDDEAGVGAARAHEREGVEEHGGAVLGAGRERAGDEQRMRARGSARARAAAGGTAATTA